MCSSWSALVSNAVTFTSRKRAAIESATQPPEATQSRFFARTRLTRSPSRRASSRMTA
jgi:hypothetical protein